MSDRHDPYAVFKIENYRNYVFGWFCALVGTRIQGVAIGWEIYQRTGEALALGMVGFTHTMLSRGCNSLGRTVVLPGLAFLRAFVLLWVQAYSSALSIGR